MERIAVDEAVLEDLWRRVDATRWPDEPPDAGPEHGIGLADARALARYWRESYDACTTWPTGMARRWCCCTAGRRACGSPRA